MHEHIVYGCVYDVGRVGNNIVKNTQELKLHHVRNMPRTRPLHGEYVNEEPRQSQRRSEILKRESGIYIFGF